MDDEKLIELIRENSVIYDLSNPKYTDTCLKERIWMEIGEEMMQEGAACKSRWNNIRDNYRKSLRKRASKSGLVVPKTKKYKYSEQLTFLNDNLQEKGTKWNISSEDHNEKPFQTEEENENTSSVGDDLNEEGSKVNKVSTRVTRPSPRLALHRRKIKSEKDSDNTPLIKHFINKNEPSAYTTSIHPVDAFLAGIAPTLKSLTPYYLNLSKSKIFAIVQEYEMAMLTLQGLDVNAMEQPDQKT